MHELYDIGGERVELLDYGISVKVENRWVAWEWSAGPVIRETSALPRETLACQLFNVTSSHLQHIFSQGDVQNTHLIIVLTISDIDHIALT